MLATGGQTLRSANQVAANPLPAIAACALLGLLGLCGCRSQAYQQVYSEEMAGEIRILEDNLYALEYENEVLQNQLQRQDAQIESLRQRNAGPALNSRRPAADPRVESESGIAPPGDDELPTPRSRTIPPRVRTDIDPRSGGDEIDLDMGEIDLGEPVDGDILNGSLPPTRPIPPGQSDLNPPQIELGEPVPPGGNNSAPASPPGQIRLPGEVKKLFKGAPMVAAQVEIHSGLSGVHHQNSDADADGVFVVLTVRDPEGTSFEAGHPISIVLLDPARQGEDTRLGRWDFSVAEAAKLFKQNPLPSYQIPVIWQDKLPLGNEVAVFIRVVVDDQTKLESDMVLSLSGEAVIAADWMPSGLGTAGGVGGDRIWR